MRVISMLEDYRNMCAVADRKGKFAAYQAYTALYPALFGAVQEYLYRCPLEALRDYVEASDLSALLRQGEENYHSGLFAQITDFVENCSARMGIDFPFDLYLGLELGNIGGASLPTEDGNHFVYIGVDRPVDQTWQRTFVPHELHHLLRIHHTGERESITLRTRMVSEGMASYCPLWFEDLPWNTETVAQSLGVKVEQAQYMLSHAAGLTAELWAEGDVSLDQTVMARYFTAHDDDGDVGVLGYFVGMWLTHTLVGMGEDFTDLTRRPTSEILALLQNRCLV